MIKGKYSNRYLVDGSGSAKPIDSSLWKKNIVKNWNKVDEFSFWAIGNGVDISVWVDAWISPGCRLGTMVGVVPNQLLELKVRDLVDSSGS